MSTQRSVPSVKDGELEFATLGGVWSHQLCYSFAIHIHELAVNQVRGLEALVSPQVRMKTLVMRLKNWNRETLMQETQSWLGMCPALAGMYQFTFTEMVRQYSQAFPTIRQMGIRVPSLTDFVYCLLSKLYSDPAVASGRFGSLDSAKTFAIVTQRLNATLCEAMKVIYFPTFSPATSAMWKIEPQLPLEFKAPTTTPVARVIVEAERGEVEREE